jgi:hypothetical protein
MGGLFQGIGSAIGGLFGYKGTKNQNVASAQQAQKQMDFQREMSNTAVQRRMADLKQAGINPILAASKEASSPSGAMAQMQNVSAGAINSALQAAQIGSTIQSTALTKNKTGMTEILGLLGDYIAGQLRVGIDSVDLPKESSADQVEKKNQ